MENVKIFVGRIKFVPKIKVGRIKVVEYGCKVKAERWATHGWKPVGFLLQRWSLLVSLPVGAPPQQANQGCPIPSSLFYMQKSSPYKGFRSLALSGCRSESFASHSTVLRSDCRSDCTALRSLVAFLHALFSGKAWTCRSAGLFAFLNQPVYNLIVRLSFSDSKLFQPIPRIFSHHYRCPLTHSNHIDRL